MDILAGKVRIGSKSTLVKPNINVEKYNKTELHFSYTDKQAASYSQYYLLFDAVGSDELIKVVQKKLDQMLPPVTSIHHNRSECTFMGSYQACMSITERNPPGLTSHNVNKRIGSYLVYFK